MRLDNPTFFNDGYHYFRHRFTLPISYTKGVFMNIANKAWFMKAAYLKEYNSLFAEDSELIFGNEISSAKTVELGFSIYIYSIGY